MLSRLVRIQLTLFAVITFVALIITGIFYVKIPQQLGIGRYEVTLQLADAGGLYTKANVSYRGTEVGIVRNVTVRPGGGVQATLSIDGGIDIPTSSIAEVRSASVVGEQYVDFVPPASATGGPYLRNGDTIAPDHTSLPTSTSQLLTSVDRLVKSIKPADLHTALHEVDNAFGGTGDELSGIIRSSRDLEVSATRNLAPTLRLIKDSNRVLATQQAMSPSIRSYAGSLEKLSSQLDASNSDLQELFKVAPPFFGQVTNTLGLLRVPVPRLLADTATVGNVLTAYRPAVEHTLIVYNAFQPVFNASLPVAYRNDPIPRLRLFFKLGLDPPTCEVGYPEAGHMRSPHDDSYRPVSQTTFCKAPEASNMAARGIRNSPCPNNPDPQHPTMRGAYASDCGLVFPRVPSPTGLRSAQRSALIAPGTSTGVSVASYGTAVTPHKQTWQQWMTGLVG